LLLSHHITCGKLGGVHTLRRLRTDRYTYGKACDKKFNNRVRAEWVRASDFLMNFHKKQGARGVPSEAVARAL
jgi:hypothetical protein